MKICVRIFFVSFLSSKYFSFQNVFEYFLDVSIINCDIMITRITVTLLNLPVDNIHKEKLSFSLRQMSKPAREGEREKMKEMRSERSNLLDSLAMKNVILNPTKHHIPILTLFYSLR